MQQARLAQRSRSQHFSFDDLPEGGLYDESRRKKMIGEPADPAVLKENDWDWNDTLK